MKFSSTDKISQTVSLIRNKKIYFMGINKCIIEKNRVLAFFQTRPSESYLMNQTNEYYVDNIYYTIKFLQTVFISFF